MKKYFLSLVAIAAMLFATSCQESLVEPQMEGPTTFTVQLPDGMGTKAIGDKENVNQLLVAVYSDVDNDQHPLVCKTVDVQKGTGRFDVSFDLIKGQTYDLIFWAQTGNAYVSGNQSYDLRTINIENRFYSNENGAAFYACQTVTIDGKSKDVTLRRPFAQLNIGTTVGSLTTDAGKVVIEGAKIKVTSVASSFNTCDGNGTGQVVYGQAETDGYAKVEGDDFAAEVGEYAKLTVGTDGYVYVSMDYLPVFCTPEQPRGTVDIELVIKTNSPTPIVHNFYSVPVQRNYRTNIVGNLISSSTDFNVIVNDEWDGENVVNVASDAKAAQAMLDAATVGTTIELLPGVNYGTLYLRPVKGSPATKEVDWIGNDYKFETYSLFENLTIIGAEGATVDAIEIEGGTYYNTEHSQMDKYPVMLSLIELKNVVIDGVTFTGKGGYDPQGYGNAINLSGNNIKVDGLTLKNCVLDNPSNNARLIYKTESTTIEHKYTYDSQTKAPEEYIFTPSLKDITITGTTFNGGYMGLELRETNNVTITDNVFNVDDRNILLASNSGCTYSGKVIITGNVSNNAQERFVRMSGAGEAEVVIENNNINNYNGPDADYIKVTDGTDEKIKIDNNVLGVSDVDALYHLCDIATGTTYITLTADISGDVTLIQKPGVKITIDGSKDDSNDGSKYKYNGSIKVHSNSNHYADAALTIKNLNFETSTASVNFIEALENGSERYSCNITVEDCTFTATGAAENTAVGVQIKASKNAKVIGCTATNMHSLIQATSCNESVLVQDCTVAGKNGVAFKQVKSATVEGTTITAAAYGIRFDGNTDKYGITVKDNKVTAVQPLIVRKMTGQNNTITLQGTNTFITEEEYQIVITNGSDDEEYVKPTGTYTLTGADGFTIYPKPILAKVGNTEYDDIDAAIAVWTNNTTLTLLADVTLSDVIKISSTEMHTLDLGTYTMTGAKGKNAIEIVNNGRSSASYALDIKADATNPGGITASSAVVKTTGKSGVKDRPIIRFYNGVFNASNIINHGGSNGTNSPQFIFYNGVYNGNITTNRAICIFEGGVFNGRFFMSVDSSSYARIGGGKFKYMDNLYGSALNSDKFTIGSAKGVFDRGVYVDDEGYIVVGGPVITAFGDKFAAKATNASKAGSYLPYSSAAANGLYYTNAEMAIAKHGEANVVLK